MAKRKSSTGKVLKEGECERKNGTFQYAWRDKIGKRHFIYGKTLEELREKEKEIQKNIFDGIRVEAKKITVNNVFELWRSLKKSVVKPNTFQNYVYMYNLFVYPDFGKLKIISLKRSDVRRFYTTLVDERNMKIRTVDNIHTVLYQVLELAVEEDYLRVNPASNAMKELKQTHNFETEKRRALTIPEQQLFEKFLNESEKCSYWKNIFTVMINTGMRVGEITALTWDDIDFEKNTISVNRTLVYYKHEMNGCSYSINTPKTKSGIRTIPMIEKVKNALYEEKKNQENSGVPLDITIDGVNNFVFINRYGNVQGQAVLNKALRYIMRECNEWVLDNTKNKEDIVLLPRFSCHSLRHTFATRMVEAGINIKVVQETLGHADVTTTLNIYADATDELQKSEYVKLGEYLKTKVV